MGHGDSNCPDSHTVEPYEVDNIVFDKNYRKGRYGGDQGSLHYNADAEKKQWIYEHILKKLDYYGHVEKAVKQKKQLPKWAGYRNKDYHQQALETIMQRLNTIRG